MIEFNVIHSTFTEGGKSAVLNSVIRDVSLLFENKFYLNGV
jgi:hypothetical protein